MSSKLVPIARLFRQNARRFTTSEKRCISREEVEKIKKQQEYVQSQNEPIHLIAGKTHFYITMALGVLVIICTGDSLYKVVKLST